jgi:hemerythrin superfamily protein
MDAVNLLTEDHRSFAQLHQRYLAAQTSRLRGDLARRLLHEAALHIALEEKYVYPIAQERSGAHLDDHVQAKAALAQLEQTQLHDPRFTDRLTTFVEELLAHSNEEERLFFPALKKSMRRSELAALGRLIQNAREVRPDAPVSSGLIARAASHVWAHWKIQLGAAFERAFSTALGANLSHAAPSKTTPL